MKTKGIVKVRFICYNFAIFTACSTDKQSEGKGGKPQDG